MKELCLVFFIMSFQLLPTPIFAGGDIALYDIVNDRPSVFRVNPDGSNLREIIKNALYPRWSHDGRMIAALKGTNEKHGFLIITNENGKIIQQVEGMQITLGRKEPIERFICSHEWSPDDKYIAFTSGFFMTRELFLELYDLTTKKTRTLYKLPVKDLDMACLSQIDWSHDGRKILFAPQCIGDKGYIGVFDMNENRQNTIIEEGLFARTWGKDRIFFITIENNASRFWSADLAGKNKEQISTTNKVLIPVSRIINDRIILQGLPKDGMPGLYVLNLKTRAMTKLIPDEYLMFQSEFSPDGEKIIGIGARISDFGAENERYGYYVYELKTQKMISLKKFSSERGRGYWLSVYLGGRKDFSWR